MQKGARSYFFRIKKRGQTSIFKKKEKRVKGMKGVSPLFQGN